MRAVVRVLLPLAAVFAIVLAGLGVVQNLSSGHVLGTLAGSRQLIPGGLVASWEPIKLMSGDGGGFFNANSRRGPAAAAQRGSYRRLTWPAAIEPGPRGDPYKKESRNT